MIPYFQPTGPALISGSALNKLVDQLNGQIQFFGNVLYVDPVSGNDSRGTPFRTLPAAYAKARNGANDVIVIVGDGTTASSVRLASTLTWAKNALHLVGICAPSNIAQRARITTATGATVNVNPLVRVTAQGCLFANFSLFQGVGQSATAEQLWSEEGQRNAYLNVAFGGMGGVAGAAHADSYSLRLYGGSENLFEGCYFGTDTRDRDAANANLLVRKNATPTASTRNVFRNCLFAMRATDSDPLFINVNESGAIDRFLLFENCKFLNFGVGAPIVTSVDASAGGNIIFDAACLTAGAGEWVGANAANVFIGGVAPASPTGGAAIPFTT